ncbi:AMIN domain-containing protein [Anabaena cylindrica FACHB-243]|uniref:Type II and III secretion system protein n=1 Tax=Anabaena cylindrica (strain ATCC 27899 / PCC 7122) TaxID=272123 RepID=K9ZG22_ANACC|nr:MULTISPECIES: type IV pilus secretin family protein [Anabaena]AFZ57537.1 type II and III secretion system protein [Anabaena cylindrica PCC 7122]MBD2418474.1 AMIN domain-containing protein [Anabaena cylindrica FACHB-243]MBY5283685.1 AMIN domain-containing protein [Anabaena sp. CCAP 1446/1C]MBY5308461.1 AMIN domain-containing protein [Anabaena sp. CCAP 1446/1C]MCM2405098.1 AMIN domain-containing protein [Anabaena sp. CCAP 1446/1C]
MKQVHSNALISSVTACVVLAAQPVLAQTTQITEVQLNPADGGISVILKTSSGDKPQVFTTKRDKALVADIINTQLRLPQGKSFRQENPAPGIASVEVNQLDANSVRVTVTGSNNAPTGKPLVRQNNGLTLGFTPSTDATASAPTTPNTEISSSATPSEPGKKIEVLVPNPEVSIDGQPAKAAGPNQPYNQAPPFLPRAVAPPVGDITQSNTDTSPTVIDLGTQERVPRLVLRDAPVREVLSLLARAAGLNLAFVGSEGAGSAGTTASSSQSISLDIENEPVQDVFNYVLRLSGLEANRSGRTIFVGTKLPNSTRDIVMRSLRLNQVTVGVALNFLVSMGAESAVSRERQVTNVSAVPVGTGVAPITQTQTTTETKVETQRINYTDSTPLLRGLQALGDERTNAVTLIGSPKLVEMATTQLTQLDIRRRQAVVNVKIIDVNLSGAQDYNTSFSFGIGNNYFSIDGGAASFNFGGSRPATSTEVANSVTSTPTITNPITGTPFLSPTESTEITSVTQNTTIINQSAQTRIIQGQTVPPGGIITLAGSGLTTPQAISPASSNALSTGITDITQPTDNIITINADGTTSVSQGTTGTVTNALTSLYQFPKRLLASLQAQVTSGNAKILTDPSLIVQEGSTANVKLTQEVVGNITNTTTSGNNISTQTVTAEKTDVGLTLAVKIDRIDDNGFVSLSVAPVVKAPQSSAVINVGGNSQTIFLVSERSLNSGTIRLRDGQTLILSGIIQDQDRTSITKVPILGDIPFIGSLFRQTNRTNERREVIVLLTPQVMDDSERSAYGYNYTPSPQVRQVLERRGLQVPGRP